MAPINDTDEPEGVVYPKGFKFAALMLANYIAMFLVALVCSRSSINVLVLPC